MILTIDLVVADYKALCEMTRKKNDNSWRLCADKNGEFCIFCHAIRECTCNKRERSVWENITATSEPCNKCKPIAKCTIGSPEFRGIRDDLENVLKIPHTQMLICILHGGVHVTGLISFSLTIYN